MVSAAVPRDLWRSRAGLDVSARALRARRAADARRGAPPRDDARARLVRAAALLILRIEAIDAIGGAG